MRVTVDQMETNVQNAQPTLIKTLSELLIASHALFTQPPPPAATTSQIASATPVTYTPATAPATASVRRALRPTRKKAPAWGVAIRIINRLLVMGLVLNAQSTHHTAYTIKQASKPVYANKATSLTQARNYATLVKLASSITMQVKLVALTAFQIHQAVVLLQ